MRLGESELALGRDRPSRQLSGPQSRDDRQPVPRRHTGRHGPQRAHSARTANSWRSRLKEGIHLYHAKSGTYLGHLPTGPCDEILFDHAGRNLISGGIWGYYRWPIRRLQDTSNETAARREAFQIGPPELLTPVGLGPHMSKAAWLPDEKTLAVIDNETAQVRLIDTSQPRPAAKPFDSLFSANNYRMTTIAISPDGKWAACGGWKELGISIWDLPSRRLVRFLAPCDKPESCSFFVRFTPDGKRLISSSLSSASDYYSWDVGTWERKPLLAERGFAAERAPVFSPDGKIMSPLGFTRADPACRCYRQDRTLCQSLNQLSLSSTPIAFSPDGTRLVAGTRTKIALLWDLKRVREQLRSLDLDWDAPPYPDVPGALDRPDSSFRFWAKSPNRAQDSRRNWPKRRHASRSTRTTPTHSMMRGAVLVAREHDEEAIRVLLRRRSLTRGEDGPDQLLAYVLNRRARSLLNADPGSGSTRGARGSRPQSRRALPQARDYVNTLGIALCRADATPRPSLPGRQSRARIRPDRRAGPVFPGDRPPPPGPREEARTLLARAMSWHSRRGFVDKSVPTNSTNSEQKRRRFSPCLPRNHVETIRLQES